MRALRNVEAFNEDDLKLPVGATPNLALPEDPYLTIPEAMKLFKLNKQAMRNLLVSGGVRFRLDGEIVLFRQSELSEDLEFIRMHESFRTPEEQFAFMLGAKKVFRCYNAARHYAFKKRNQSWLNEVKSI